MGVRSLLFLEDFTFRHGDGFGRMMGYTNVLPGFSAQEDECLLVGGDKI